jgi:ABC-type branched-subunit amino acid transport system substrate-binding protein
MINRRQFSFATGATAILGFPAVHAQSDKIVLGQSAPFTGPAAQLGIQYNAGAQLYFSQLNAAGGIGGRTVEIRQLDDGYDPERCAENTRKFIEQDVLALFAYVGTPTSLAAMPLALKSKVPFIAPFTGAMALRNPLHPQVFHVRASYADETALIVKQLNHVGLRKVAVLYQNDAYGKAGLDGVTQALAKLGSKPVAVASVERNTVDVAQAVSTINESTPDAVVQISAYKTCAAYIRAARKAGYGGQFFNVSFVGTKALSDELGKDGAGVVVSQVVPSPFVQNNLLVRDFTEAVLKSGGAVTANYSSLEGFLAARVMAEGLRRGGAKGGRDGLISGLESIGSQSYGGFNVNFSKANHVASSFVELSMLTGDGRVRT